MKRNFTRLVGNNSRVLLLFVILFITLCNKEGWMTTQNSNSHAIGSSEERLGHLLRTFVLGIVYIISFKFKITS